MEKQIADRSVNTMEPLSKEYTVKDVRVLIIQNIMGYNNTQPRTYWQQQENKTLLAYTGPADRLFFERLLYYANEDEKETQNTSENENK